MDSPTSPVSARSGRLRLFPPRGASRSSVQPNFPAPPSRPPPSEPEIAASGPERGATRDVSPLGTSRFEQSVVQASRSSLNTPTSSLSSINFLNSHLKPKPRLEEDAIPKSPSWPHFSRPFCVQQPAALTHQSSSEFPPSPMESLNIPMQVQEDPHWLGNADASMTSISHHSKPGDDEHPGAENICGVSRFSFDSEPDSEIDQGDECPGPATMYEIRDIPVYDGDGASRPFFSLYDPLFTSHKRQLIIFVRHFYCGSCQKYLQALTEYVKMQNLLSTPMPTNVTVIGCGHPEIIRHYRSFTQCPFTMYTDPSRKLFRMLGMRWTLHVGRGQPDYMKDISVLELLDEQRKLIAASLRDPEGMRKRDILRGGNPLQIGGEFLFEDGEVVWCHRMKHIRNHSEVRRLRHMLQSG